MKKFSYDDWYSGNVEIEYNYEKDYSYGENSKPFPWNDFNEDAIEKIKKKQRELFECYVKSKLDELQYSFKKRYFNSKMKKLLIEKEKKNAIDVLEDKRIENFKKDNHLLDNCYLFKQMLLQDYYSKVIVEGFDVECDFIMSPNAKNIDDSELIPQVYAVAIFNYYNWLNENYNSPDIQDIEEKNISIEVEKIDEENPYPSIFKLKCHYDFFLRLKKFIVDEKSFYSDYSFIFHSMKNDQFILNDTKHKTFIDFLNDQFNTEIVETKLKVKYQSKNKQFYKVLKEESGLI